MDRMIEEVVRRKSRTPSEDLKALLKQKTSDGPRPGSDIGVEYEFVIKADPSKFLECPIIEVGDGHYFCTFDGRDLMFNPDQVSPYIFLPFSLRRAIFHRSGDKMYFITLDTSNKLQYSLLVNGYPSEERHVISRNVQQVTKQSNKIFYVSTKNELSYINMVVEDNGVLRGRMCISGIKSRADISMFYANSVLFINTEHVFRGEDGKELPVQGDMMCEMDGKILVLDGREEELCIFLLDEKHCVISQLKLPTVGRVTNLFPLGSITGIVAGRALYLISERSGDLFVTKEVDLETPPLSISLYLKEDVIRISEIIVDEEILLKEFDSSTLKDSVATSNDSMERNGNFIESTSPDVGNVKIESKDECSINSDKKFPLIGSSLYTDLLLGDHEGKEEFHRTTEEKNDLPKEDLSMDSFSPYIPDKNDSGEIRLLDEKINMVLKTLREIGERVNKIEKDNSERFRRLIEIFSMYDESKKGLGAHGFLGDELQRMIETLGNLEARLRSEASNESKILDCVKKIILGTLVPAVEAAMDEIRIQMINEIRLIHNEDHLKNVKRAVDGLHTSFNKQNEIKGLISEGLIEEAAEIAIKGSESNLETFVSNVEISCLEHLSSSILVALLERVLVIAKDDFKAIYQNFTYMVMMCLEPNDLNDEEVQILEILMAYINNIEGLTLSDVKGLPVILDFQRLKLNKIKDKRGIK
ncbi:hypothetical protein EROM_110130 [Encephalitozoon romaleae SJ-2008]|uniref:Uncharacterized protein n=1 Tax=Encephalitozoon romaleae (strain SJ-2008) TaxID=1178016 RepID=I7AU39_ENCRO|nr:hypothetical protein EROM_110130 [Encephalitozoon romaleae SJ-2008]AFN83997.1 hypothetical protein EROM_110130 [Encephalitozoon romaleae SJ-2008]